MPVKKATQQELAEKYGVTRKTISTWKRDGVDIYSEGAVRKKILSSQKKAPNTTVKGEAIHNGMTLEDCTTLEDAKFLKEIVLIQKEQHKLDVEQGKVLSLEDLNEAVIQIGAVVRASILRIAKETPQLLEGMEAKEIEKVLGVKCQVILQEMTDEFIKLCVNE